MPSQFHCVQVPDFRILNAQVLKRLSLRGVAVGGCEQGERLMVVEPLMIAPRLS